MLLVLADLFRLSYKLKFKLFHSYFSAAEFHAFHFQTEALVESVFTGRGDPSARRHDPMPGQIMRLPEYTNHKPRSAGKTRGLGDSSIGRDLTARDLHDSGANVDRVLLRCALPGLWLGFGHD